MAMDISNFAAGLRKFGLGGGKQTKGLDQDQLKKAFGKKKGLNEFDKEDLSKGVNPDMAGDLNPQVEAPKMELQNIAKPELNPMEDPEEKKKKRLSYFA